MPKPRKRKVVTCDDATWARFQLYGLEHDCYGAKGTPYADRITFAATLRHLLNAIEAKETTNAD